MLTIELTAKVVMAGVLRPALAMPPLDMLGAVGDRMVSEKDTAETPLAKAVMVTAPAVLPNVTVVLAVPSFSVMAGEALNVTAPEGVARR